MTRSHRVTEEQIAAAQLRLILDEKQGRATPDAVKEIANSVPGDEIFTGRLASSADASDQSEHSADEASKLRSSLERALEESIPVRDRVVLVDNVEDYRKMPIDFPDQPSYGHRHRDSTPADIIWLPHSLPHSVDEEVGGDWRIVHAKGRADTFAKARQELAESFAKYWLTQQEDDKKSTGE